ncbi:MAG: internalization-related competence protein ComEC/Rec2 protein [Parcubacteria group bacterium GW2011_GWB1_43_6]|nr:MAG: internalization-related competence protein ComEC/Rec2 protein [Parcubacteria group bacterium GW2011_GWB1_43_6]
MWLSWSSITVSPKYSRPKHRTSQLHNGRTTYGYGAFFFYQIVSNVVQSAELDIFVCNWIENRREGDFFDIMKYMKKQSVLVVLGTLFGFNILAWIGVFQINHTNLEVTFFDVRQGDSIFIETSQNQQIIIDGGPTSAVLEKLGQEMPFWDRTIDLIILTHPEHDHMAGLIEVLKRYQVENILWTGVVRDTAEYKEWQRLIREEGANIYIAQAGQQIKLARAILADILYPFESLEGKNLKDSNGSSIVARLGCGAKSFLFTGDAPQSVEKELVLNQIKHKVQIDSDVLKAGHHGSKTSSAEEFIKAVSPEVAVISVGKDNSYGHPHPEVLEVFKKYGTKILRTDLNGDIKISCNSQSLKLESGGLIKNSI